jgi:outer membrane autotransporter protein
MISGFPARPRKRLQVFSFILFLIAALLPSLAAAQTATVTFTASGSGNPVVTASSRGQPLSSPAEVDVGDTVDFEWDTPRSAGRGLANLPAGCGATHVSGRKWTAVITGDCRIHFETSALVLSPQRLDPYLFEGSDYSQQFVASHGVGSPVFFIRSGTLPPGLSLSSSGVLSGRLTTPGSYAIFVTFDDGYGGVSADSNVQFTILRSPTPIANPVSASIDYGSSDNLIDMDITGGAPTSVAVATPPSHGTAVPSGLQIGYTPAEGYSGADSFTYTATNAAGTSAPATVSITVGPAHTVSWTADGPGHLGSVTFLDEFTGPYLSSPVEAAEGRRIAFWTAIADAGAALTQLPTGCGVVEVGLAWYTDPITADCHVTFKFEEIAFSPSALSDAVKGVAYSQKITASGSYLDFTYSISGGDIADEFSITSDSTLTGTPTETGSHTIEITASNSRRESKTQTYALNVVEASKSTVSWSFPGLAPDVITATADGNALSSGDTVPPGSVVEFIVKPRNGSTYYYAPSACGIQYVSSNSAGDLWRTAPVTQDCSVAFLLYWIGIQPDRSGLPRSKSGQPYEVQFSTRLGYGPFTDWSWSLSGDLPTGLSLDAATGKLSGTPQTAGTFAFSITATNTAGHSYTEESYSLTVEANGDLSALALSAATLTPAFDPGRTSYDASVPYEIDKISVTPTSSDPAANITVNGVAVSSGAASQEIPLAVGNNTITVAVNASDATVKTYTIDVTRDAAAITLGPGSLPDGVLGATYGPVTLTADGGVAPYTFHQESGGLPLGMSLHSDGSLLGTPTVTGNFSFVVKATDDAGSAGLQTFTLTVAAPEIDVSIPSLPDGKVNTAYPTVQLSAAGGTEPYKFTVSAGSLPEGIELAADGTLSGTPKESGDFSATVTATDQYGSARTADISIRIKGLDVPVAQDMALEVLAGTTGSIDLTRGATNGPFTAADIVVHPATEAGKASVRESGAVYMLDFAAAGAFAGSASLQYTLSNADGRSAPATVTLNVIARPDPSQDPEVIGLLTAQTETAKRFAKTQIDNFNRRLEQLHDEGDRRRNSMNVNVGMTERNSEKTAYAEEERDRDPVADAFRRVDSSKKREEPTASQDEYNPLGNFAVWTGGYVNFAKADSGGIDLDSTLVGVSGGVDYRFSPQFVAGLGFGYGRDKTEIGDNGTESRGRAWSMAAYGSYKPTPNIFIDGLLGYGFVDFDSRRFVTANGNFAIGSRGGRQVFGSLTAGYEYRDEAWLVSPYGRLEASRSKLDGFTEKGGGIYRLTYGDQTVDTLSGVLGLRLEYAVPMGWGVLKPRARLEYTHDFEGSSRVSLGYTDVGTMPYGIDIDPFSRDYLIIGLGFDAQVGDGWNLGFDYRTAYGSGGAGRDHTFAIKVGATF